MILLIDNYDSFTFNLVQYLGEFGVEVRVVRNDAMTVPEIQKMNPDGIVISPGPCTPNEAGISVELIKTLYTSIPILGVCLGHQAIGQAFGGEIVKAPTVVHGKVSTINHNGEGFFARSRTNSLRPVIIPLSLKEKMRPKNWRSPPGQMITLSWVSDTFNHRRLECSSIPNRSRLNTEKLYWKTS